MGDKGGQAMYGLHNVPAEARYLCRRGIELSHHGDLTTAEKCFRQAITIAPRYTGAHLELYGCLVRLGREKDAMHCYHRLNALADGMPGGLTRTAQ